MQKENLLPVQYRIEFYEGSVLTDPVYTIQTSSAPFSISIGDKVDTRSWEESDISSNAVYRVSDVIHLLWTIENSHVGHSLSVVLSKGSA